MSEPIKTPQAILAEFKGAFELLEAAAKIRNVGYKAFDCHSPFPIHGMDQAMGLKRSPLGWIVGAAAICAVAGVTLFIWWTSAVDYPLVISGKPYFSFQAFVPVIFALAVLTSAFAAFFGMLVLNRLPRLFHPLFYSDHFAKFSNDGFLVSIESSDPKFDLQQTKTFLEDIGSTKVEVVEG